MWRSFFTEKKWFLWSWGGFAFIILSLLAQTYIDVKIIEYYKVKDLYPKQKAKINWQLINHIKDVEIFLMINLLMSFMGCLWIKN